MIILNAAGNAEATSNLFLSSSNLVGVGTSTPTASLTVSGNLSVSNAITTSNMNVIGYANISNIFTTNIVGFVGSQWTTGTGNVYYTANVGIGGTLNVSSISNLNSVVAGSLAGDGAGISNINSSNLTGTISSSLILANTLTNVQASAVTQPFANLVVSNALTTTNVSATLSNIGTLNVATISNLNTLTVTNNLYAANALQTTNILGSGIFSTFSNKTVQSFDFTVASTAGSFTNVCSLVDSPSGSAIYAVHVDMMTRGAGGSAQTKTYIFTCNYNNTSGVWTRALPLTNPTAGGQIGLDVMTTNGTTYLRATNRNAAETVNVGMVVSTSSSSFSRVAITDLTSQTGTGATSTGFYPTAQLTHVAGRVGITIEQPAANLHVVGNIYVCPTLYRPPTSLQPRPTSGP